MELAEDLLVWKVSGFSFGLDGLVLVERQILEGHKGSSLVG